MGEQTYQHLSRIVLEDLKNWSKKNPSWTEVQKYFFEQKKENPERYERMLFDTNGREPLSEDLSNILLDFKIAKKLDLFNNIIE